MIPHLAARRHHAGPVLPARPLPKLLAFRTEWLDLRLVSSAASDFNYDYAVSFTPDDLSPQQDYNFGTADSDRGSAGISVFYRNEAGDIFTPIPLLARLDMMNRLSLSRPDALAVRGGPAYPMDWSVADQ